MRGAVAYPTPFTGHGWRRGPNDRRGSEQAGCFVVHPAGRGRCERPVSHRHFHTKEQLRDVPCRFPGVADYHSCDNGSWPA